jgi:hypothetical protein
MEALGIKILAAFVHNASSQKPIITAEWSDSSEYLPGADVGQEEDDDCVGNSVEKVSSQPWMGIFASSYLLNLEMLLTFIQFLISNFPLSARKLTIPKTSGDDETRRQPGCLLVEQKG